MKKKTLKCLAITSLSVLLTISGCSVVGGAKNCFKDTLACPLEGMTCVFDCWLTPIYLFDCIGVGECAASCTTDSCLLCAEGIYHNDDPQECLKNGATLLAKGVFQGAFALESRIDYFSNEYNLDFDVSVKFKTDSIAIRYSKYEATISISNNSEYKIEDCFINVFTGKYYAETNEYNHSKCLASFVLEEVESHSESKYTPKFVSYCQTDISSSSSMLPNTMPNTADIFEIYGRVVQNAR